MENATVELVDENATVRVSCLLNTSIATTWLDITERERLQRWYPCDVAVQSDEWSTGAAITFTFNPAEMDMVLKGTVLFVDEPVKLSYTWGYESTLVFELTPQGEQTELAVFDTLPKAAAARNAAGWEICLARLQGIETPDDQWPTRFAMYSSQFAALLGEQQGPPTENKGG